MLPFQNGNPVDSIYREKCFVIRSYWKTTALNYGWRNNAPSKRIVFKPDSFDKLEEQIPRAVGVWLEDGMFAADVLTKADLLCSREKKDKKKKSDLFLTRKSEGSYYVVRSLRIRENTS